MTPLLQCDVAASSCSFGNADNKFQPRKQKIHDNKPNNTCVPRDTLLQGSRPVSLAKIARPPTAEAYQRQIIGRDKARTNERDGQEVVLRKRLVLAAAKACPRYGKGVSKVRPCVLRLVTSETRADVLLAQLLALFGRHARGLGWRSGIGGGRCALGRRQNCVEGELVAATRGGRDSEI